MKNSPLKYNVDITEPGADIQPEVPAGPRVDEQPIACNKTRLSVCKNSLHLRWGMEIRINDQRPASTGPDTPVVIESITYSGGTDVTATVQLSHDISNDIDTGSAVTFHGDRGLNFHPDRKITGLNVIDGMIYWTDNHSEPKKINIERSKEGSKSWKYGAGWDGSIASIDPYTWPGCQRSEDIACYSDFDQHTKLIVEGEHIMDCENSTSTCYIYGCTDMTATNYNPNANYDDGSCIVPVPVIYGCDDGTFGVDNDGACNRGMLHWSAAVTGNQQGDYNTNDTNLCIFPDDCEICEKDSITGLNTGAVITDPSCGGCTDPNATNYNPNAIFDDGSCIYIINPGDPDNPIDIPGCKDPNAINYNPAATVDDGSCIGIGSEYEGGLIFWLDGNGGGLVAADQDPGVTCGTGYGYNGVQAAFGTGAEYGCIGQVLGANNMGIDNPGGAANTNAIVNNCPDPTRTYTTTVNFTPTTFIFDRAAHLCYNWTHNGYSDWFLPSSGELAEMSQNIMSLPGNPGNFSFPATQWAYWSSTEIDADTARKVRPFFTGTTVQGKDRPQCVRCVRRFYGSGSGSGSGGSGGSSGSGNTTPITYGGN